MLIPIVFDYTQHHTTNTSWRISIGIEYTSEQMPQLNFPWTASDCKAATAPWKPALKSQATSLPW